MLFRSERSEVRIIYQREFFFPEIKGIWFLRMPVFSSEQDKHSKTKQKIYIDPNQKSELLENTYT